MNVLRLLSSLAVRLFCLILGVAVVCPIGALAKTEQTFDMLQIGTHRYTNVTVTANTKTYVFLMHAGGILNLKVIDLPQDVRDKLGYTSTPTEGTTKSGDAAAWLKKSAAKIELPALKQFEQKLTQNGVTPGSKIHLEKNQLYVILALAVVFYLGFCHCCSLICKKTGQEPGVLIWLPILQIFPLLRAAGMSGLWFLAYCVPVLNIIAQLVWAVKISRARGKTGWVAFFLILPLTSFFAFLYLAFSEGEAKGPARKQKARESRPKLVALGGRTECALGA